MIEIQILKPDGTELVSPITVEASTTREAVTALKQHPEFDPQKTNFRYLTQIDNCNVVQDLDERVTTKKIIMRVLEILTPRQLAGAGNNPYVRIIIGVILMVVAVIIAAGDWGAFSTSVFAMGFSLVVGGFIQLLTPQEESAEENAQNYSARNFQNTVTSGTPIPIILGEHMWGGHVFSANIDTKSTKGGSSALGIYHFSQSMFYNWSGPDSWKSLYSHNGGVTTVSNGEDGDTTLPLWDDSTFDIGYINFDFGFGG